MAPRLLLYKHFIQNVIFESDVMTLALYKIYSYSM